MAGVRVYPLLTYSVLDRADLSLISDRVDFRRCLFFGLGVSPSLFRGVLGVSGDLVSENPSLLELRRALGELDRDGISNVIGVPGELGSEL